MYTVHFTVYSVHFTLYSCTLYSVQCALYTIQFTGYTIHSVKCIHRYDKYHTIYKIVNLTWNILQLNV